MRVRAYLTPALIACLGALLVAWDGLLTPAFTDYETEAEPAFDLLRSGHVHGFLTHAPPYGGSLILRAPFVLAIALWHGGADAAFRASAVPAMLASIVLSLIVFGRLRGFGAWLALVLVAANPLTLRSYEIGHPEELLGAVLCIGAALAALEDRALWAGVLIGLAVANKPWAALAVGPVVLALSAGRGRALVAAAGACALVMAPLMLAGGQSVSGAAASAHTTGTIFVPGQIWWFFGSHVHHVIQGNVIAHVGYRTPPAWVSTVAHPFVILVCVGVSALWWRLRRDAPRIDALGLLTLVLLLRCLLDPWNVVYYELPFVLALITWEASAGRAPLAGLLATLLAWCTFAIVSSPLSADGETVLYLAWALPFTGLIALRVFAPRRFAALGRPIAAAVERGLPSLAGLVRGPAGAAR